MLTSVLSLTSKFLHFCNVFFSFNHYRLIKTGHWTTRDLFKYLISVLPTLRHTEVERLRCTPAFPAEATTEQNTNEDGTLREVQKFKASDLYEPLDVFRVLGLPAIDWQGKDGRYKWSPDSEEGTPMIA